MDTALKRSRSDEPAELPPPAREVEEKEEEEERMEQGLEEEEEEVDPRIQGELEKLNQSTDDINRRETELEDARQKFRSVLVEATVKLDELAKKIGKAVEDSKPYWEARRVARQAQLEAQKATQDFQRATEVLRAAKETISLAEQRLLEDDKRQFDSAWQEMLNHATQRQLKKTVDDLQAKLALAKGEYKAALKSLERISDEIHERRRSNAMGPRGCGVGAEGSIASVENLPVSKPEPDAISVASEAFEDDNCSNLVSEDDSETQSVSSFSSGPTSPSEMPDQFPAVARPGSLDLPSPVSLSEFGMMFPILGPRSECSGASSPECEVERGDRAEGAENKMSDKANNNRVLGSTNGGSGRSRSQSSTSLESQALETRMKQLSLQCSKGRDGIIADIKMVQIG
ncbi:SH3 domain-binding protein 5 isoform 6 [Mus musculus]|uniref:SH3 domain-binding protein 5 isoform 6 n=1 Tax=Mus musculus TaxID=10090 RepID=UPI001FCD8585|nr:SH3 domain-binding protein 5 isoform 6 [Mus musculus]